MEEKDDWTCGREGDRHPFTEINLQDEFLTPITLVLNYTFNRNSGPHAFMRQRLTEFKVGCFFLMVFDPNSTWCSVETTTIRKTHSTLVFRTLINKLKASVIFKTTYSFVVFTNMQTWMLPSKPLLVTLVTFLMSLSQFPLVNICSV